MVDYSKVNNTSVLDNSVNNASFISHAIRNDDFERKLEAESHTPMDKSPDIPAP